MSILSKGLKKLGHNKIVNGIGHAVDMGSNFLPPGFREAGHVAGGLMQNKNLKSSVISAGESYLGGKVMGALGSKFGAAKGAAGGNADLMAKYGDPSVLTSRMANAAGAGGAPLDAVSKMANIGSNGRSILGGAAGAAGAALSSGFNPNGGGGRTSTASGGDAAGDGGGGGGSRSGGGWRDWLKGPGVAEAGIGLAGSVIGGIGQGKIADADRKWDKDKFGQNLGWDKDKFGQDLANNKDQFNRRLGEDTRQFDTRFGEDKRQFDQSQIVPQGNAAMGAQASIDTAPTRDRALAMLNARMGAPQSSFVPHDIFNPSYGSGPAQMGGVDQNQMNQANADYKPGQGGVTTSVQQALLKKLGYA